MDVVINRKLRKRLTQTNTEGQLTLEKVFGLTTVSNNGLAVDSVNSVIYYPAGCVVVQLDAQRDEQTHIVNADKKAVVSVAVLADGTHIAFGEAGYDPSVQVWHVEEGKQICRLSGQHKYQIPCIDFSPNMKYLVSIGNQHDGNIVVWNWRTQTQIACNKISQKISAISFSENSEYFVTAGSRHLRFWYFDKKVTKIRGEKLPLTGKNAILGDELRNNVFTSVRCCDDSVYAVTQSGKLVMLSKERTVVQWVALKVECSYALSVGAGLLYCGCSNGVIRVFRTETLRHVCTLPKPHRLGVDVADSISSQAPAQDFSYPDCIALQLDTHQKWLSAVYNDHSIYVWNLVDDERVKKVTSHLYHSRMIWDLATSPIAEKDQTSDLPVNSFVTCGMDGTVRVWNPSSSKRNAELHKIFYTNTEDLSQLIDKENIAVGSGLEATAEPDQQPGARALAMSPEGHHLAIGSQAGNISIVDVYMFQILFNMAAHEHDVTCLQYSGQRQRGLLASGGRDRIIHIFDAANDYTHLQVLSDHNAPISALRFIQRQDSGVLSLVSCGRDRSLIIRSQDPDTGQFTLQQNVVGKTALYDLAMDPSERYAATGCHDRKVRVYNARTGTLVKLYVGAPGDEGFLTRLDLDPSGTYLATACSDKTVTVYDFYTGNVVSTAMGNREMITGVKFLPDMKHLVTVSADSCIFLWRLSAHLQTEMSQRLQELGGGGLRTFSAKNSGTAPPPLRRAVSRTNSMHDVPAAKRPPPPDLLPTNMPEEQAPSSPRLRSPSESMNLPQGKWAERTSSCFVFKSQLDDDEQSGVVIAQSRSYSEFLTLVTIDVGDDDVLADDEELSPDAAHSVRQRASHFLDMSASLRSTGSESPGPMTDDDDSALLPIAMSPTDSFDIRPGFAALSASEADDESEAASQDDFLVNSAADNKYNPLREYLDNGDVTPTRSKTSRNSLTAKYLQTPEEAASSPRRAAQQAPKPTQIAQRRQQSLERQAASAVRRRPSARSEVRKSFTSGDISGLAGGTSVRSPAPPTTSSTVVRSASTSRPSFMQPTRASATKARVTKSVSGSSLADEDDSRLGYAASSSNLSRLYSVGTGSSSFARSTPDLATLSRSGDLDTDSDSSTGKHLAPSQRKALARKVHRRSQSTSLAKTQSPVKLETPPSVAKRLSPIDGSPASKVGSLNSSLVQFDEDDMSVKSCEPTEFKSKLLANLQSGGASRAGLNNTMSAADVLRAELESEKRSIISAYGRHRRTATDPPQNGTAPPDANGTTVTKSRSATSLRQAPSPLTRTVSGNAVAGEPKPAPRSSTLPRSTTPTQQPQLTSPASHNGQYGGIAAKSSPSDHQRGGGDNLLSPIHARGRQLQPVEEVRSSPHSSPHMGSPHASSPHTSSPHSGSSQSTPLKGSSHFSGSASNTNRPTPLLLNNTRLQSPSSSSESDAPIRSPATPITPVNGSGFRIRIDPQTGRVVQARSPSLTSLAQNSSLSKSVSVENLAQPLTPTSKLQHTPSSNLKKSTLSKSFVDLRGGSAMSPRDNWTRTPEPAVPFARQHQQSRQPRLHQPDTLLDWKDWLEESDTRIQRTLARYNELVQVGAKTEEDRRLQLLLFRALTKVKRIDVQLDDTILDFLSQI